MEETEDRRNLIRANFHAQSVSVNPLAIVATA